jgi:hypothetical protein
MVFFVIETKTRAVKIAGIQVDPGGEWMKQVARNLTDPVDGFLRGAKYLIHDRDPLFTEAFTAILRSRGVEGRRRVQTAIPTRRDSSERSNTNASTTSSSSVSGICGT